MTNQEKQTLEYLTIIAERSLRYLWFCAGGLTVLLFWNFIKVG